MMRWLLACAPSSEPVGPAPTAPVPSTSESGGQSGEDPGSYPPCEGTRVPADEDDEVFGVYGDFTAADLRTFAEGVRERDLSWTDGTVGTLVLTLAWDGPIWLVPGDTSGYCDPLLSIDGTAGVVTDDGRLDEAGPAVVTGWGPTAAAIDALWSVEDLEGTWTPPAGATAIQLSVWIDEDELQGLITADDSEVLASF